MVSIKRSRGHLGAGIEEAPDPIFATDGKISLAAQAELRALVSQRYVHAKVCPDQPNLVLFNYTSRQQAHGSWTSMSKACRGLVLRHWQGNVSSAAPEVGAGIGLCNASGNAPEALSQASATVVARPLAKFFNIGEHSASLAEGETFDVLDKVDGSLGIVFHVDGAWRVITRGSWVSSQAAVASEMLAALNMDALDRTFTYCVEIVFPENRIVVDYGQRRELTLLAATEIATGRDLSWDALVTVARDVGCPVVRRFGTGVCAEAEPAGLVARVMGEWGADVRGDEAEGFVLVGARCVRVCVYRGLVYFTGRRHVES
jgi:hypothetical protein